MLAPVGKEDIRTAIAVIVADGYTSQHCLRRVASITFITLQLKRQPLQFKTEEAIGSETRGAGITSTIPHSKRDRTLSIREKEKGGTMPPLL